MLRTAAVCTAAVAALATALSTSAGAVSFDLVTHSANEGLLPQPQQHGGDHLLQTGSDDGTGSTFNPDGAFSFNFMNPAGIATPPGYAEGIHSMSGSLSLDVDLAAGGAVGIQTLHFEGYVAPGKLIAHQRVVNPGDPATDGKHGPVNGSPNSGTYVASALSNWALAATFDWYYDTQFAGAGTIDMTFNDYAWTGFIIPVSELTPAGMAATALDDPLDYFGGTSADFEAWLLAEVAPLLPGTATHLLFAQGEAHPDWTNPKMGMTKDGIVGATIIATVPEPSSLLLLACGAILASRARRRPART